MTPLLFGLACVTVAVVVGAVVGLLIDVGVRCLHSRTRRSK
jgi:hypothetical protein